MYRVIPPQTLENPNQYFDRGGNLPHISSLHPVMDCIATKVNYSASDVPRTKQFDRQFPADYPSKN